MLRRKKIIIVCYPSYGGSGVIAMELGKELAVRDYEVHVISYQLPIRFVGFQPSMYFHEVKLLDYPVFNFAMYESALTSTIVDVASNNDIHIIHAHYAIPHAYTALLAKQVLASRKFNLKVVTTLHGTDITLVGKKKVYKPLVEYAINTSDEVSAVSDYLSRATCDAFHVQRPIKVIRNFVDNERFANVQRSKGFGENIACCPDDRVITHISNFRAVKRTQDVINIFYHAQLSYPQLTLIMIGDGPDRSLCESRCRELGICYKIRFVGKVDNIELLLGHTDIFIMPSQSESFGLAALEALAAGVPVIASRVGGVPDLIDEGVCGYLHEVGDTLAMSESVLRLLRDDKLMRQMRKAAKNKANQFDIKAIADEYETMYAL